MKNVLIVGYGVVGHNLAKELSKLNPDIYDKFKTEYNTKRNNICYDFAFICVDTPFLNEDNINDISQVENAIQENYASIYVIKSTILPGTVDKLIKKFNKHIVFSPEYYGGTQHCNNFNFNYTILGGDKDDCCKVQQLLQDVYDARHIFRIVDSATAEFSKYMENCYLGMKVSFCNDMNNGIEKFNAKYGYNVKYEDVRELFVLDPRVNPSHTYVYDEHRYYDSHCLNKDIPALAYFLDLELLKSVITFNDKQKEKR